MDNKIEEAPMLINDYPEAIENVALQLFTAAKQLDLARETVGRHELEIKIEILNAKNEAGKPIYSNEAQRDCAIAAALADDDQYQRLLDAVDHAERLKATHTAKLERLRSEYRITLIDYEADRLGRRPAA